MLDKRTLARINDRPRGRGAATYARPGVVVAAAIVAFLVSSYALATVLLLAGAAGVFLLHKRDAGTRTVRLTYGLDGGEATRFAAVREACEALSGAERVWRVEGEARETGASYGTDLSFDGSTQRYPVEVGPAEMPGISTNAEVWGKTGAVSLFFLLEAVLSYREDQYRAVSYDTFGVVYRPLRGTEAGGGAAPGDTEVVGEARQHVRPDGGPDIRYPNNPRYPVVLYGLLSVTSRSPVCACWSPTRRRPSGSRGRSAPGGARRYTPPTKKGQDVLP